MRIFFIMFVSLLLSACSPDYNWRSITLGMGEITAFFPDKPLVQHRELVFAGQALNFSLTSTRVSDVVFAVGYAALPPAVRDEPKRRTELAAAAIRSVYQNLGQAVPDPPPKLGESFQVNGQLAGDKVLTKAKVWLTETALVEGLVSAVGQEFPEDQSNEFFRGLVLPAK